MLFRVNEIGLFQKEKKDIVKFNDEINFISGESSTGKSSIGAIINYCLGSSKNIPGAKIANDPDVFIINLTIDVHCWDAKNLASARIHTWPPDA